MLSKRQKTLTILQQTDHFNTKLLLPATSKIHNCMPRIWLKLSLSGNVPHLCFAGVKDLLTLLLGGDGWWCILEITEFIDVWETRCVNIFFSNYTELERMPRENGDDSSFENLDGPYQRLQARYGSWKNGARPVGSKYQEMLAVFSILCILYLRNWIKLSNYK